MTYFLLFISVFTYSYYVPAPKKLNKYLVYLIPIMTLILLALSLQYNVGTDYFSYFDLGSGDLSYSWIEKKGELLFVLLIRVTRYLGYPQLIFLFSALIQIIYLSLISFEFKKIEITVYLFFFLYFTYSTIFFNQFNGIRQYIAIYIVLLSVLKLSKNTKFKFVLNILIASMFHSSAVYFLIFLPLFYFLDRNINTKHFGYLFIVSLGLLFINMEPIINSIIRITPYNYYLDSSFYKKINIVNIVTKLPKILMFLYVVKKNNDEETKIGNQYIYNVALTSMLIQIFALNSSVLWRFYLYLEFFTIYPMAIYLSKSKDRLGKMLIVLSLIIMFLLKVIVFPIGEYKYQSILTIK